MKKLTVIAAVVSMIALATFAYGEMGGPGMGRGMMCGGGGMDGHMMVCEHHMANILKGLDLDEQQKASLGEIKSRMMKETIRGTADMRIYQIELKELLDKETVDMKAVEAKVRQMEMLRTEMHLSRIKAMEYCKSKLTPAQRIKLKEMMEAEPMMEGMGMKHNPKHDQRHDQKHDQRHDQAPGTNQE